MRLARQKHGFTMIEVLIAIGILTVGALGMLSMHQTVMRANRTSRDMNHGMTGLQTWMSRLERDALGWKSQGNDATTLQNTEYLALLVNTGNSGTDWIKPSPSDSAESWAFDFYGNDTGHNTGNANATVYCTNIRLTWLRQGSSARVDVRVFWMLEGRAGVASPNWVDGAAFRSADCEASTADTWFTEGAEAPNVNVVYGSTVLRWTGT